jgi:GWxTD domain-containing protein
MARKIITSIIVCFFAITTFSQEGISAFFYSAPFYSPEHGAYLETYMAIVGESVNYKELDEEGMIQATVEVTMLFKQNNEIVDFRKYNLNSPAISDTLEEKPNFVDLQRIPLESGVYSFELMLKDLNAEETKEFKFLDIVTLNFNDQDLNFSGIEFVESYEPTKKQNIFTKNDYDLVPYVSDFLPNTVENLIFYVEIYNMDKAVGLDNSFLLKYYIEGHNTNKPLNEFSHFRKQISSPVNVVFSEMAIDKLPSGNFNLVVEVRDKTNKLLKKTKFFFQRSNPGMEYTMSDLATINIQKSFVEEITSIDSLKEYIKSLRPISDEMERTFADNQLKSNNIELMQQFFLNFWEKRNTINPGTEWERYKKQVQHVNESFSTQIKKGYETDMGRVYLQYGTPNTITDQSYSRETKPYQIWHYYRTQGQANRKFVFAKEGANFAEYVLVHSNARGEIRDPYFDSYLRQDFEQDGSTERKSRMQNEYDFVR